MFKRATVPGIRCNWCILQILIICRSFSFVEPVCSQKCRVCQISSNLEYFPSDSHKTKILYLEIYSNESKCNFLPQSWTFAIPLNFVKQIRWCSKDWSIQGYAPSFFTQVLEGLSRCWSFEVEIKTADLYSLHKQRYCILHLFTCRVLAFSHFPVGTYIKT